MLGTHAVEQLHSVIRHTIGVVGTAVAYQGIFILERLVRTSLLTVTQLKDDRAVALILRLFGLGTMLASKLHIDWKLPVSFW